MCKLTISKDHKKAAVYFNDNATIGHATQLQKHLQQALAETEEIQINLKNVNIIDIPILQLIWSAAITAKKERKKFALSGKPAPEIKSLISDSGFDKYFFKHQTTKEQTEKI